MTAAPQPETDPSPPVLRRPWAVRLFLCAAAVEVCWLLFLLWMTLP